MAIKLLEHALTEAAKLPEGDQRAPANWILLELQSERRRREAFAASQRELGPPGRSGASRVPRRGDKTAGIRRMQASLLTCPMADTKNEDLTPCPYLPVVHSQETDQETLPAPRKQTGCVQIKSLRRKG